MSRDRCEVSAVRLGHARRVDPPDPLPELLEDLGPVAGPADGEDRADPILVTAWAIVYLTTLWVWYSIGG